MGFWFGRDAPGADKLPRFMVDQLVGTASIERELLSDNVGLGLGIGEQRESLYQLRPRGNHLILLHQSVIIGESDRQFVIM